MGCVRYLDCQKLIWCEAITLFSMCNYHLVSIFVDYSPLFLEIVYIARKSSFKKQRARYFQQN